LTPGDHSPEIDSTGDGGAAAPGDLGEDLRDELAPEFELVRPLGGGGLSTVYLAREPSLSRLVAIKVLDAAVARHPKMLARFRREARALASVSHPNVVSVFRVGDLKSGLPYLVMQYIRGRDLAERLEAEGPLDEIAACDVLTSVAAALAAVHAHGIVHRDVRPESILCEHGTDRIFLADFGLATYLTDGDRESARLTTAGHVITDYRCSSPEVLKGLEPTTASDVYSLGVLGYYVLARSGPYRVSGPEAQVRAHLHLEPIALRSFGIDVEPELENLLGRCLAKAPQARPPVAEVTRTLLTLSAGTTTAEAEPHGVVAVAVGQQSAVKYRFTMLGGLDLQSDAGSVDSVLRQPKRVALLAFLAAGMPTGLSQRDTLIGVFWPDATPESGRHSLRQAVYVLRRGLGADAVVGRGDDEVGLNPDVLSCDAADFDTLVQSGRAAEALALYRGDLLPGFYLDDAPAFERWLETERLRLRRVAARASWIVSTEAEMRSDRVEAARWARHAVDLDPFDESSLYRLIELLDAHGDRAGAISAYDHFARRLADEYASEPFPETRQLVARVRGRSSPTPRDPPRPH